MKRYLLAHDLGTSGNKATLFTTAGRLANSATVGYASHFFNNNWAEQNPEDWWRAVVESTRAVMGGADSGKVDPGEIAAICFSGQMMGCLCVDAQGRPLRPHLLYCDQRAVEEEARILSQIEAREFYRIVGHRASASYSAAKLMWVQKHEPELYARTHKMLHAKDWLNFRLTGVLASEYSDASGTNLLDLSNLAWSPRLVQAAGLDGEKLPRLLSSTDVVGELTREAAEALGLRAGIPVVAGAGDGVCAAVGVGSVKPGLTYNYLGSSSWIATTSAQPILDPEMRTFVWAHAVPGMVQPCGTMQTAGSSYAWLKNQLCALEKAAGSELGLNPYELMNSELEKSPPGANGLIFLPYLLGERTPRWNPEAKGALIGLTLEHTRADVIRAVIEGVTLNLSIILDIFREKLAIERITVIGGGAKGAAWRRIMADVYQAEVLKPDYLEEATSMGAAIIGGVGCGVFQSFEVADRFIRITEATRPDPAPAPAYRRAKELLNDSYAALEPLFGRFGKKASS